MSTPGKRPTFTGLVAREARDPWILLVGSVGAGLAWATGVPIVLSLLIGVLMTLTAAGVAVLSGKGPDAMEAAPAEPRLRPKTEQQALVRTLDGYIADLERLRSSPLADDVSSPTIEALVAAQGSREGVVRAAAAVDMLDDALTRAHAVNQQWGGRQREIGSSVQRMAERRQDLMTRLHTAVGEVAEVYTKLLELSATAGSAGLSAGDASVDEVSDSLDALRVAFAELDAAATE